MDSCDEDGCTLMHYACKLGWLEVVKSLVVKKGELNSKDIWGKTPLLIAAEFSHLIIVNYLNECCGLEMNGCDQDGWTILHYACEKGWLKLVKSLIKSKSDVNAQTVYNDTPLLLALDKTMLKS